MKHIYSTLTSSQDYAPMSLTPEGVPYKQHQIIVYGGHGLIDRNGNPLFGTKTTISNEDYELIKINPVFQAHIKAGFVVVLDDDIIPEKAISDLEQRDKSAPMTSADLEQMKKEKKISKSIEKVEEDGSDNA